MFFAYFSNAKSTSNQNEGSSPSLKRQYVFALSICQNNVGLCEEVMHI